MDKDLFKTIDSVIRKERLYAQVNLMREDIMQRFNIGRHHLNDQLNTFADGMSFPQYINSIRMEVAYDLLRCYGFTPAEYRSGLAATDEE